MLAMTYVFVSISTSDLLNNKLMGPIRALGTIMSNETSRKGNVVGSMIGQVVRTTVVLVRS